MVHTPFVTQEEKQLRTMRLTIQAMMLCLMEEEAHAVLLISIQCCIRAPAHSCKQQSHSSPESQSPLNVNGGRAQYEARPDRLIA